MSVSRRQFLTYLGAGTYTALRRPSELFSKATFPLATPKGKPPALFKPIEASSKDALLLPEGYKKQILCRWGDALGSKDATHGPETFGYNNDLIVYFPIDALKGGNNSKEGLLWVNHEYPNPVFVSGYKGGKKTTTQIRQEKLSVGGSVIHVRQDREVWRCVVPSKYNRRLTALYPELTMTGPATSLVPRSVGTLANCSGGRTPWFTALSCEENFQDYNSTNRYCFRWKDVSTEAIDENQYGWVVEVDPFGELPPVKHTALGRFSHENTAWRLGKKNHLVVYMGDDAKDQYLYKFVSASPFCESDARKDKRKLLEAGTLYVAHFGKGQWLPLDIKRSKDLQSSFRSQAEVLIDCRKAASLVGATPIDRPEDCEVHPVDGSLYLALTNNDRHGNFYGQIVRLVEKNDDAEAESFQFEIFLAGGPQSGLACPDNLAFDREGNLWVVCDISSHKLNQGIYQSFGNNGLYVVPTKGPSAGEAFQFASGPVECELTGPWFTEDNKTLFLSVQHPGEGTRNPDKPTSTWPDGGTPKPSIVAITGFAW